MARYRISRAALRDLDSIWLFIARENERAANALMDQFSSAFQTLVLQPRMGRSRPDIGNSLRSFVVREFVIFYEIASPGIRIVRVWDGRQEPRKLSV